MNVGLNRNPFRYPLPGDSFLLDNGIVITIKRVMLDFEDDGLGRVWFRTGHIRNQEMTWEDATTEVAFRLFRVNISGATFQPRDEEPD